MKRKQLWKVLGTGGLALSLLVPPMTGVSALAAEEGTTGTKTGDSKKDLDPTQTAEKPAVGDKPAKPAYADVDIPVWGFTQDTTVYSVDVEWGAMTFQYENSTWDPKTHTKTTGAGWQVYDSVNDKALVNDDGTKVEEDAINEIKVTNHSNAGVWATLTYAGESGHTDTTGGFSFTKGTVAGDTNALTLAADPVPAYLTLTTANNNKGEAEGQGKETVGKAYFMPNGIGTDDETNGINKWTKIGTITVGIEMKEPTAATPPVGP